MLLKRIQEADILSRKSKVAAYNRASRAGPNLGLKIILGISTDERRESRRRRYWTFSQMISCC